MTARSATPPPAINLMQSANRLARAYVNLGNTFFQQNQFDRAIESFQKVLNEVSDIPDFELAKIHCNIGLCLAKQEKTEEAIAQFNKALACDPELYQAKFHLERLDYEKRNQEKGYRFVNDWFSYNMAMLRQPIQRFAHQPGMQFLEIGCGDGRATCWFLEEVLIHESARITCIDSFTEEADTGQMESGESRFDHNIGITGQGGKVTKLVGNSAEQLRSLSPDTYHFIYIDGSPLARDVLTDAVLAWGLLKANGLLVFADYGFDERNPDYNPKLGTDAFMSCFAKQISLLHRSSLVILEKLA
jgi:tetratricopeptide (TPR) repeat protein